MSQLIIASRYAKALFTLADKQNQLDDSLLQLKDIADTYDASKQLQSLFNSTKIGSANKKAVLDQMIASTKTSEFIATFCKFLLSKKRFTIIAHIHTVYSTMIKEKLGQVDAEVTVATELSDSLIKQLADELSKTTKKTVSVSVKVDPSILGGIKTKIGSTLIDGSILNQINNLKQIILKG